MAQGAVAEAPETTGGEAPKAEQRQARFKPIRIWTGGPGAPMEKIYIAGQRYGLRPRMDGSYLLRTPEEVEAAKRALGTRFWPDDLPDEMESLRCDMCGWTCRSIRAMQWHLNNAHGRPQAG